MPTDISDGQGDLPWNGVSPNPSMLSIAKMQALVAEGLSTGGVLLTGVFGAPVVGKAFSFAPVASGGSGANTFTQTGTLPSGLSFNSSTGAITGTPTAAGTYPGISVKVSNSSGMSIIGPFTLTVAAQPFTLSGTPGAATVDTAYSFVPGVIDGVAPISYSLVGTLPAGLSFSSTLGSITGTPTQPGTFSNIAILAKDVAGALATLGPLSITVSGMGLSIGGTPPSGRVGQAYSFTPTIAGGIGPFGYTLQGMLPPGLSFNASTGAITGTPYLAGQTWNMAITVNDTEGATATLGPFVLTMIGVSSAGSPLSISGMPGGFTVAATGSFLPSVAGGTGPYSFTLSGSLPSGLSFSSSTGAITGAPSAASTTSGLSITVTDNKGATATLGPFTIVVAANTVALLAPGAAWTGGVNGADTGFTSGNPAPTESTAPYGTGFFQKAIGGSNVPVNEWVEGPYYVTVGGAVADRSWIAKVQFFLEGNMVEVTQQSVNPMDGTVGFVCQIGCGTTGKAGNARLRWKIIPVNGYERQGSVSLVLNDNGGITRGRAYADPVNGSDSNVGTQASPTKTIVKAIANLGIAANRTANPSFVDSDGGDGALVIVPDNAQFTEDYGNYLSQYIAQGSGYGSINPWNNARRIDVKSASGVGFKVTRSDRVYTKSPDVSFTTSGTALTFSAYPNKLSNGKSVWFKHPTTGEIRKLTMTSNTTGTLSAAFAADVATALFGWSASTLIGTSGNVPTPLQWPACRVSLQKAAVDMSKIPAHGATAYGNTTGGIQYNQGAEYWLDNCLVVDPTGYAGPVNFGSGYPTQTGAGSSYCGNSNSGLCEIGDTFSTPALLKTGATATNIIQSLSFLGSRNTHFETQSLAGQNLCINSSGIMSWDVNYYVSDNVIHMNEVIGFGSPFYERVHADPYLTVASVTYNGSAAAGTTITITGNIEPLNGTFTGSYSDVHFLTGALAHGAIDPADGQNFLGDGTDTTGGSSRKYDWHIVSNTTTSITVYGNCAAQPGDRFVAWIEMHPDANQSGTISLENLYFYNQRIIGGQFQPLFQDNSQNAYAQVLAAAGTFTSDGTSKQITLSSSNAVNVGDWIIPAGSASQAGKSAPSGTGSSATVSANAALGATTIQLSARPTENCVLAITGGTSADLQYRTVVSVTGSASPYTVTLDAPLRVAVAATRTVTWQSAAYVVSVDDATHATLSAVLPAYSAKTYLREVGVSAATANGVTSVNFSSAPSGFYQGDACKLITGDLSYASVRVTSYVVGALTGGAAGPAYRLDTGATHDTGWQRWVQLRTMKDVAYVNCLLDPVATYGSSQSQLAGSQVHWVLAQTTLSPTQPETFKLAFRVGSGCYNEDVAAFDCILPAIVSDSVAYPGTQAAATLVTGRGTKFDNNVYTSTDYASPQCYTYVEPTAAAPAKPTYDSNYFPTAGARAAKGNVATGKLLVPFRPDGVALPANANTYQIGYRPAA